MGRRTDSLKRKTINVSPETWKELVKLRVDLDLKSIDELIQLLLKNYKKRRR